MIGILTSRSKHRPSCRPACEQGQREFPERPGTSAAGTGPQAACAARSAALEYAVELEELSANPLHKVKWKPPKTTETVDPRVVVNPRQAQELLTAVTYVGRRGRGRRLMALFACMYYAALRPAEAVGLRIQDCHLPASGWGLFTIDVSRPEVNTQWTDSGDAHEERGLKHRGRQDVRPVPIPPELVKILREHMAEHGTAKDGRIFSSERGGVVASTAYTEVWQDARLLALTPAQIASPLAKRPYDLRTRPYRSGSTQAPQLRMWPNERATASMSP